jgi:hypothetical protein
MHIPTQDLSSVRVWDWDWVGNSFLTDNEAQMKEMVIMKVVICQLIGHMRHTRLNVRLRHR